MRKKLKTKGQQPNDSNLLATFAETVKQHTKLTKDFEDSLHHSDGDLTMISQQMKLGQLKFTLCDLAYQLDKVYDL